MQDKYKPVVTDWLSVLSRVKLSGSREGLTIWRVQECPVRCYVGLELRIEGRFFCKEWLC